MGGNEIIYLVIIIGRQRNYILVSIIGRQRNNILCNYYLEATKLYNNNNNNCVLPGLICPTKLCHPGTAQE